MSLAYVSLSALLINATANILSLPVGRGVLRSCTNLVLEHSLFAVPEQILVVSSIENIQEGTIWMALPLVEIVVAEVAEVAEDKSRVHV